jgi:catechol 2,3-dioxygenase-like lactoylglutathione lyase family enzyme
MLQHVALEVDPERVPACVEFWRLLGFASVAPPASIQGRATWLARAGTQIHLLHTEAPFAPRRGHAAVVVDDYERTLARLREAGHDPESRRAHWGAPRAFVRDPAGHRVEVMSAPPPA